MAGADRDAGATRVLARRLAAERERAERRLAELRGDLGEMVDASRDTNADDEHDPEEGAAGMARRERREGRAAARRRREGAPGVPRALPRQPMCVHRGAQQGQSCSGLPGHTIAYERSQVDALIRMTERHLAELDTALDRLDEGSYGRCEMCGQPIPAARLEVRPMARACVGCR